MFEFLYGFFFFLVEMNWSPDSMYTRGNRLLTVWVENQGGLSCSRDPRDTEIHICFLCHKLSKPV